MSTPQTGDAKTSPSELGVIFSSRDGYVWASWPRGDGAVRLGPSNVVTAMMLDFIAQEELARRLANREVNDDHR